MPPYALCRVVVSEENGASPAVVSGIDELIEEVRRRGVEDADKLRSMLDNMLIKLTPHKNGAGNWCAPSIAIKSTSADRTINMERVPDGVSLPKGLGDAAGASATQ